MTKIIVLFTILIGSFLSGYAQTKIDQNNVGYVVYKTPSGLKLLENFKDKEWQIRQNNSRVVKNYTHRQLGAHGLQLKSSAGFLVIDFHTTKVKLYDKKWKALQSYTIVKTGLKEAANRDALNTSFIEVLDEKNRGHFQQIDSKTWKEYRAGNYRATYKETNRTKWTITFQDNNRNITYEADLHKRKITHNRKDYMLISKTEQRSIPQSSPSNANHSNIPSDVTARNATLVKVKKRNGQSGGEFKMINKTNWQKIENGMVKATFTQKYRSDDAIILSDYKRKIEVQLNFKTKKVTSGGAHYFNIFFAEKNEVAGYINPQTATYVQVNKTNGQSGGYFKKTGSTSWKKYENGKEKASFTAKKIDTNTIHLYDAARKITVILNLINRDVRSNGAKYFDIIKVNNTKL